MSYIDTMSQDSRRGLEAAIGALGERTRLNILLSFYDDPRPRTVDEVAVEADVHRTVAFQHLERLARFGYLATELRRGFRGKPAKIYHLAGGPIEISHPPRLNRQLAGLLAQSLARFGYEGRAAGREAGYQFGLSLGQPAPDRQRALVPLESLGGRYKIDEAALTADNCVFREACTDSPQMVCEVHAGILQGVLESAGHPHRVVPRGPRVGDGCSYALKGGRAS